VGPPMTTWCFQRLVSQRLRYPKAPVQHGHAVLQCDLATDLQELVRRQIKAIRGANRIAIHEGEQYTPPWRQPWRVRVAHDIIM
jgi:hypothetical protein